MKSFLACACLAVVATVATAADWESIEPVTKIKGWHVISGEWTVENGALVGKAASGQAAIALNRSLADFEFEAEFHTPAPCVAGAFARAHVLPSLPLAEGVSPDAAPKSVYGYRLSVDTNNFGASGNLSAVAYPEDSAEVVSTKILPAQQEWNAIGFSANGNAIAGSIAKGAVWMTQHDRYIKGAVVLIAGSPDATTPSEVHFRNIRVKDNGRAGNWRALWNGADFDGFEIFGEEKWDVIGEWIVGTSGPKKSEGYLKTNESFKDFRVRGTYKMLGDGNYGLFYHSTIEYDEKQYPVISGVQGEVAWGYPSSSGCLYESYKRGWLKEPDMNTVGAHAQDTNGENEIEIMSEGNRRVTWVNGIKVTDFLDETPNYTEGSFALQLHAGGVSGVTWKNLYVLE